VRGRGKAACRGPEQGLKRGRRAIRRRIESNKALQLTSNSAFQPGFGSISASILCARSASEALLAAAERLFRWADKDMRRR
jgi:hypothetical protein